MGAIVVKFWRCLLLCGLVATLAGCAWLDTKQRELMYRPTLGKPTDFVGLRPGDQVMTMVVPGATPGTTEQLQLWWLPNPEPQAPTLLYLHGTFRNLFQNFRKIEALRAAGFSIVAVEYRGWGESSAVVPSEASIYADAATGWVELTRRQSDPHKRVIFGHSMGSGVAVELASQRHVGIDYGGLILESSFTRLPDVARSYGVFGTFGAWFATQRFDSIDKIGQVDAPILMLHGSADNTVPMALGRALFEAAPAGTQWVEFPGGSHSGLDRESPALYRQSVQGMIARLP